MAEQRYNPRRMLGLRIRSLASRNNRGSPMHRFSGVLVIGILGVCASPAVPRNAETLPDFSGFWSRAVFGLEFPESGPGPTRNLARKPDGTSNQSKAVGDYNNPNLTPEAARLIKRRSEVTARGEDYANPSNHCLPMVAPYIFRVQGMEMLQRKDEVLILYMQDHQVRHVRLNSQHPARVTPTWHGDSIGHYEGGTLVIDTVGVVAGDAAVLDQFGTPFSGALHVVERYRMVNYADARVAQDRALREYGPPATEQGAIVDRNYNGKGLQVRFTVEDKNMFIMPWSGLATYLHAAGEWVENVCAENIHEYYAAKDTEVPQALKPDF